jgi:hypothetical protein
MMAQLGPKHVAEWILHKVYRCVRRKKIVLCFKIKHIGKNKVKLNILFYLETAIHVSGGTSTHQQERKQLYLQHLVFVTVVAVTVRQIPDAAVTVVCAPDDGWIYHPKHVQQFPDKMNCVTLHLLGYVLEYVLEKLKTQNVWSITLFSRKRCHLWDNVEKKLGIPQTTIEWNACALYAR